jgi:signal transduction histidine kinase
MICVMERFAPVGSRYHRRLPKAFEVVATLLLVLRLPYTVAGLGQEYPAQSAHTYRTVAPILALPPSEAAHGDPAQLRGVVTKPTEQGLFFQDSTAGIWITSNHPADLAPGDEVEVEGIVSPGLFSPIIRLQSVRKIGTASLPRPVPITYKQLITGDWDSQYVSITGTVRSAGLLPRVNSSEKLWLRIATDGGFVDAAFPEKDVVAASKLIDAVVRIDGVTTASKNLNRQLIEALLSVSSLQKVTVLKPPPEDLFAEPLTPIEQLMRYKAGTDYDHRVRVAGTVTYSKSSDSLILEDKGSALMVMTRQASDIKPGDQIEALGFPTPKESGPVLQDAVLRSIGPGPPPRPRPVEIGQILSGSLNNNLISIEGHLLRRLREPSREALLLQIGSTLLVAELRDPTEPDPLRYLQDGSTIRVSGVSIVEVAGPWHMGGPTAGVISSIVLLRSPEDVQVIEPPSWWTTLHVIYIAVGLVILSLALLVLIVYNHMERGRLRAVLDERERLANEVHDTLAQSFAGIGFQLQAISKAIPNEIPRLRQQVDLARTLVRHSHKEARRSIEPLDSDGTETDLMMSLVGSARKMVEGCSVEVVTVTAGTQTLLPPRIATCLLRIGQEAIANAVRHADPTRLEILIAYEKHSVRLSIRDNGCGFVQRGDLLGFGLRGMRKRAAAISGRLEIASQPGEGTGIEVTAPLPPNLTPVVVFRRMWKHVWERKSHVNTKAS